MNGLVIQQDDENTSSIEKKAGHEDHATSGEESVTDNVRMDKDDCDCDEESSSTESLQDDVAEPLIPSDDMPLNDSGPTFRGLLFFKFLYFLNGLSASTWGRFSVIYYNDVAHLSPEQIGVLQAVAPLISLVMMPVWGGLADYLQSRKRVFLFCKTMGTICLVSTAFLRHPMFVPILLCVSGVATFRASAMMDAYVLDYLGQDNRDRYGEIRVWTAISWGLGAIAMGYITDYLNFNWNFALYGTMMMLMVIIVAFALPSRSQSEQQRYDRTESKDYCHDDRPDIRTLYNALMHFPILWWIIELSVVGSGMAIVESFLFLYMQNDLGASTRLCGWTVGVTVLFEIPIFTYSKICLREIGHDGLFVIALVAYSTRVYGYTLLTESTVQWILALEILHGVTFACIWIASIDFSAKIAPPEWSTTMQSILAAAFTCFGSIVGPLLGGWIIQEDSAVVLYRGMAIVVLTVLFTHCFLWHFLGRGHGAFLKSMESDNASVTSTASLSEQDENDQPI